MIQLMVQNDLRPRSKVEINDEICSLDRLVPYVSLIYDNLFSVLEGNRIEEMKVMGGFIRDESYTYMI